jgi:hypothetical protein
MGAWGCAWSGAGAIDQMEVSVDGGEIWHSAHIEQPATVSCGYACRTAGTRAIGVPIA